MNAETHNDRWVGNNHRRYSMHAAELGFYLIDVGVSHVCQNHHGGSMKEEDRWERGRLVRQLYNAIAQQTKGVALKSIRWREKCVSATTMRE